MFQSVKSKSIYWKYLLLKIKYIFLRDSYVCTRWIFIFDSDQAQINSVEYPTFQTAVGITVENWTNQRLEFPELNTAEGAVDRQGYFLK
jgi:hypothetical protein